MDESAKIDETGCPHSEMDDVMIDVIGPPELGVRKTDGAADVLPSKVKGKIPGSRCRSCGFEIPKNTGPTGSIDPLREALQLIANDGTTNTWAKAVANEALAITRRLPGGGEPVAWRVVCDGKSMHSQQRDKDLGVERSASEIHGVLCWSLEGAKREVARLDAWEDAPDELREQVRCGPHRAEPLGVIQESPGA